jgi:hypothetical protein
MGTRFLKATFLASLMALGLAACDEGPAEKMGEELDEAAETIRDGEESIENKLDDAADEFK